MFLAASSSEMGLEALMAAVLLAVVFYVIHALFIQYFPKQSSSCRGLLIQVMVSGLIAYLAAMAFGASEHICSTRRPM